jgi:hypothetical protein
MIVTILGSCRQDSIYKLDNIKVTSIKEQISYTHYSNEILEVIKFFTYGDITPEETVTTFRTPILQNKPIHLSTLLKNEFESTDVFVIEIASKKAYKFNGRFVHHILFDFPHFNHYKDKIQLYDESDEEIENNILLMKSKLNKPIIIVGHICTYNRGFNCSLKYSQILTLLKTNIKKPLYICYRRPRND